jgi:hypothetical protein
MGEPRMPDLNRYSQIIERIFLSRYRKGQEEVEFAREDMERAAHDLKMNVPKNLGDIVYTFRSRGELPKSIRRHAPKGHQWVIMGAGRSRYKFVAKTLAEITPSVMLAETKIPDATPGMISMYALDDEQALLAKLRYNRLIDIFTGVTCYSLQSHLRTTVKSMGQVESDEVYIGIDRKGVQYVFPIQAKGGRDSLNIVQILQDFALCEKKFPSLVCRPIGAQFMGDDLIALFEFERSGESAVIASEKHYRLVPPDAMTDADLRTYRERTD